MLPRIVVGLLSVGAVVGGYWFYASRPEVNAALVPTPPVVIATFFEALTSGNLFEHALASLQRVLIGYGLGISLAVLLGCLAGWFRWAGYILDPLISTIRPIPTLAYIPLLIVWVGIGEPSRVLIILLAAFKVSVVNNREGMREVPSIYIEAAETLGASRLFTFWSVALPSAIPFIIAGMRTALSTSFMALVAAELIAASNGLGFMISNAGQYFRTDLVLAGIIAIAIIAVLLDAVAARAGRYLTRWSEAHQ